MPASGFLSWFTDAYQVNAQAIATNTLLNTLTTAVAQNGGNRALGEVHQDTQDVVTNAVRSDAEDIVTYQLIYPLIKYNFGPDAIQNAPTFHLGGDGMDSGQIQNFNSLINSGVLWKGESHIRKTLGLPEMSPDDEKRMNDEKTAENELKSRMIDAKQQTGAKMSDFDFEERMRRLRPIYTEAYLRGANGK